MKKCLILLVFAALGSGCVTLPEPDFSPAGPRLSVVTYNVNWGCPNPHRVIDYLLKADADIVCLQETHRYWEGLLRQRLGQRYPYSHFRNAGGAGGIAIMSKYELRNVSSIEPAVGWFPALLAEVESPLGPVQILNVHLRPRLSDRGSVTVPALYRSPEIHRRELDQFLRATHSETPLIIAGDFNESEKSKGVQHLLSSGFTDALSLFDRSSDTWFWRVMPGITLRDRYDHIVFSRHLRCTGAGVSRVKASDHMPVLAVFVPSGQQHALDDGSANR